MPLTRNCVAWLDIAGNERLTYLNSNFSAIETRLQLESMSNAGVSASWEGPVELFAAPPPSAGDYNSVGDVLALRCEGFPVGVNTLFLPAPKAEMFDLDNQTWDSSAMTSSTLSFGITSACLVPVSAAPVLTVPSGYLMRRSSGIRETFRATGGATMYRRSLVWADVAGRTMMTWFTHILGGDLVVSTMQFASNAQLIEAWDGELVAVLFPPVSSDLYSSVTDYAQFIFADDRGTQASVILPAPKEELFLPDTLTVDGSNLDVQALINWVLFEIVTPGSRRPLVSYVSGRRKKSKIIGLQQGPI